MAYDRNLKSKAVQFYLKGNSLRVVGETFSVGHDSIKRWVKEYNKVGDFQSKVPDREHLRVVTSEKIETFLKENPNGNQRDMARYFGCTNQSVSTALKKFGYSKKNSQGYTRKPTQ